MIVSLHIPDEYAERMMVDIDTAASMLGMSRSRYIRAAMTKLTKEVIDAMGGSFCSVRCGGSNVSGGGAVVRDVGDAGATSRDAR